MADARIIAGRVARLRAHLAERGWDAALIRSNADLRWLTGAERLFDDELAHTALVTADGLWLHTDSRYFNTFRERLGEGTPWLVDQERVGAAAWAAAHVRDAGARTVAVEGTLELSLYDDLVAELARAGVVAELPRMRGDVRDLRMVKDEGELALLRRAQEVTDDAFDHMCGWLRPGVTEMQARVELESHMLTHGGDGLSFGTIMASGPNGANPHAVPGQRVICRGDLVVMDYGATYCDYHADMTRTVAVGEAGPEERHVYDVVRRAHETAAAAVRPGCIGRAIHEVAAGVIAEAGYGEYFGHGLGHGVGIEIHENPSFGPRWERPCPEGSVVTVEPGIYLPGRFGIRLEDCGVIGPGGYEPFTRATHELVVV